MLIDFHVHLDPGAQATDAPRARYRDGIPVYTEHPRSADVQGLLAVMDTCGIDVAVLSSGRGLRGEATEAKDANRALADICARYPDRLRHLAHVPPPGAGWLEEVDSWLDTCPGAAVPTDYGALRLDDERFEDLYSLLERRRRFLWVHPSMAPGPAEARLYDVCDLYRTVGREFTLVSATLRLVLGGTLDRHPGLVLVMSHLGGGISALAPRVRHYQDKAMWGVAQDPIHGRRPQLPFDDYLKRIYFDTGGFFGDPSVIRIALEHIPGDRILLGTDYPQEIRGPEPIRGLVAEFERQGIAGNGTQLIGKPRYGVVTAVSRGATHMLSKPNQTSIRLLTGLGVEGDAHLGETVRHRSRVARDPSQPNLRQVHLLHAELLDELRAAGFAVSAGQMGENITTRGVDLLGLPAGTRLHLGDTAVVEVTGLRNPCAQLDRIQPGLMAATLERDAHGNLIRKAGIMGIVLAGGEIRPGDPIGIGMPPEPHCSLRPV